MIQILQKKNKKKRKTSRAERERTYSKTMVTIVLTIAIIDSQLPYILSAFGRDPVSDLGIVFVTEIIAVCLGYFLKSYFGKKNEEQLKYDREANNIQTNDGDGIPYEEYIENVGESSNDSEAVG